MASRVVLVAAVLSTVVTGCNRRATGDTAAAGSGSGAGPSSTMSSVAAATPTPSTTPSAAATDTGASPGAGITAAGGAPAAGTSAGMATDKATTQTAAGAAGDSSGAPAAGSTAGAAGATPSDPQIAEIVTTANTGEINAGKLAESKAKNAKVKEFAKDMIKEHTAVNQQVAALAKKTKMSPAESDTSKMLKDDAAKEATSLKGMSGAGFDKAYIDSQVDDHEKVLQTIDAMLLPNAKDADLKAMLQKVRPSVASHLEHAKTLQASMK